MRSLGMVAVLAGFCAASAGAQSLGMSARQMSPGSLRWNFYYQGVQGMDLNFSAAGNGRCSGGAPNNPGFACGSVGDVGARASGGMVVVQAVYQPWDHMQYYASVGVGDMTLRVSSVSVTNALTGDRPGVQYALGARAVLLPDTVVSPAVVLDGRLALERHYFRELRPALAAAEGQIDQRLELLRYQVALQAGHRFDFGQPKWSVEPYGGLKWLRTESRLRDFKGGGRMGGIQDTFTPFVGLLLPFYEHEAVFSEASFVNGYQYSVGLQIRVG